MAKKVIPQSKYHCRDCQYAYDYHEKNSKGEYLIETESEGVRVQQEGTDECRRQDCRQSNFRR